MTKKNYLKNRMAKNAVYAMLLLAPLFMGTSCGKEDPIDPCLQVKQDRDAAESKYNTNANSCLTNYVPACMNHSQFGSAYKTRFDSGLGTGRTRNDSLVAADYADKVIQQSAGWTNGTLPEDFKENVTNAGQTGRDGTTYYGLWQQLVQQAIDCANQNGQ